MTRLAIQVAGLPRFCSETDQLIECWQNYDQVDWYIALWQHTTQTSTADNPHWTQLNYLEIAEEFSRRFPPNHRLLWMAWYTPRDIPQMPENYEPWYSTPLNVYQSARLHQKLNVIRRYRQDELNLNYDFIVRARLDAAPNCPLDSGVLSSLCREYPRSIHTPANHRQGPWLFSDQVIIAEQAVMNRIADSVDDYHRAYVSGVRYNSECLLGYLLENQGINWPTTDWSSTLKTRGEYDTAGVFHPELGTWSQRLNQ